MAERTGLSKSTTGRIWRQFNLKPHRADTFKVSTAPLFVEEVVDVVGLYHHPPERAVVLCVDEKSQMQALARSTSAADDAGHAQAAHPRLRPARTTSLFAAFNIADGTGITELHRRHRATEFRGPWSRSTNPCPPGWRCAR